MQRCLKFVKHLGHFNVEPTVITVDPAQATYPVRDESLLAEVPPGVRVIRTGTTEPFESYKKLTGRAVPYGGFANEGKPGLLQQALRFVRGNLFIPDPRRGWNRHALAAVEKLLAAGEQFDAVLTSSPPHSTQLIGLELQAPPRPALAGRHARPLDGHLLLQRPAPHAAGRLARPRATSARC